jgi:hypothetical protein
LSGRVDGRVLVLFRWGNGGLKLDPLLDLEPVLDLEQRLV